MCELGWALSSIIAHRGLTWGWGIYNIVCKIELTFCFLHIVDNLSVIIFWWPKLMKGQLQLFVPIPGWSISKWQIQQNSARWHFLHREMTLISSTDDNVYTVLMHWFTFWLFICEGCSWCLERGQSRPLPSLGPSWSQDELIQSARHLCYIYHCLISFLYTRLQLIWKTSSPDWSSICI